MARSASIHWDDQISPKLQGADKKVDDFMRSTMQLHATRAQAAAKRNAKWRDRTGNARSGLVGVYESGGRGSHKIILAHGVPYGIWLEVRWSGRLAIINPTISAEGAEVMRTVQGGLGKIFS